MHQQYRYQANDQRVDQDADRCELNALRAQSAQMKQMIDTMPVGVVIIDGNGFVSSANQMAISLLGQPLVTETWLKIIQRAFRPQEDDGHEVSLWNGRRVKLDIRPLEDQPGQLILLTDLTETRMLQQKVSHLQRLSALGKMVASLAHQVRTPLSAALLYAANLGNNTLSTAARQTFHRKLLSRLQDLEQQVNDMLLFSKNGNMEQVDAISMQDLLSRIFSSAEAMVVEVDGELTVDLPDPDITIMGNSSALASALSNLIHNAVEVIGENVKVYIQARRSKSNPELLELVVEDNGPGIDERHKQRIFEPFYTTRKQGTGLGLSVVKSVINSHQGSIDVTRSSRGGARFVMTFPIYQEAAKAVAVNHA